MHYHSSLIYAAHVYYVSHCSLIIAVTDAVLPEEQENDDEIVIDPEMVPVYIKRFLPLLTQLFHSNLSQSLRLAMLYS